MTGGNSRIVIILQARRRTRVSAFSPQVPRQVEDLHIALPKGFAFVNFLDWDRRDMLCVRLVQVENHLL